MTQVSWYSADAPGTPSAAVLGGQQPDARTPRRCCRPAHGSYQFDPGQASFGFVSRWPFFANRMVYSQDSLNTFTGAIGNHVRVYRLVEDGATVPNAYVVATEEHTSGWDYNDVVFVVRNVHPPARRGARAAAGRRDQGQLPDRDRRGALRLPARLRAGLRLPAAASTRGAG